MESSYLFQHWFLPALRLLSGDLLSSAMARRRVEAALLKAGTLPKRLAPDSACSCENAVGISGIHAKLSRSYVSAVCISLFSVVQRGRVKEREKERNFLVYKALLEKA